MGPRGGNHPKGGHEQRPLFPNQGIESPNIMGDVGFLSGLPRTATAKAKTEVMAFVLKYENFMNVCKGTPEWLSPLLSSFVSGVKALHYKIAEFQDKT
jgi:CRP-like cAMP-binding protein